MFLSKSLKARQGANWRDIYKSVVQHSTAKKYAVTSLDSLEVFLEVYGQQLESLDTRHVASLELFAALLDLGCSAHVLQRAIQGRIRANDVELALDMLSLAEKKGPAIEPSISPHVNVRVLNRPYRPQAATDAILYGNIAALKAISASHPDLLRAGEQVELAVLSNDGKMMRYILSITTSRDVDTMRLEGLNIRSGLDQSLDALLEKYPSHPQTLKNEYDNSSSRYSRISAPILRVLLKHGMTLTQPEWKSYLMQAIDARGEDGILLALEHTNPDTPKNQALLRAVQTGAIPTRVLLADARVDPNKNLLQLVLKSSPLDDIELLLTKHSKVNIDKLSTEVLEALCWRLDEQLDCEHFVNPSDKYWMLARYILLKQATRLQIVQYMIRLKSRDVSAAAASVLDSALPYSNTAAPFRALLIYLLYPTMSIEESESRSEGTERVDEPCEKYLVDEGYTRELIDKSNLLIRLAVRANKK